MAEQQLLEHGDYNSTIPGGYVPLQATDGQAPVWDAARNEYVPTDVTTGVGLAAHNADAAANPAAIAAHNALATGVHGVGASAVDSVANRNAAIGAHDALATAHVTRTTESGIWYGADYGFIVGVDTPAAGAANVIVLNSILAAMYAANGGTLVFPSGVIRFDLGATPIRIPDNGAALPTGKSVRLTAGAGAMGGSGASIYGGTTLDLRDSGCSPAKIDARGANTLEIDHIILYDGGVSSTPFIQATNTCVMIHDCTFYGNPGKSLTSCDQDAIVLGGMTAAAGNGPDSAFQGYGSVIYNNHFDQIRRIVYGRVWCNGVVVRDNTAWNRCGTNLANGAAIEWIGHVGNSSAGNVIIGNLIEQIGYPYAIRMRDYTILNSILYNNIYDAGVPTTGYYYFDATSVYNLLVTGFNGGLTLVTDLSVGQRNTVITSQQSQVSRFSEPVYFSNTIRLTGANPQGPTYHDNAGNEWLPIMYGNKYALAYTPSGGAISWPIGFSISGGSHIEIDGLRVLSAQGAAVADATGAGDIVAQFNTLLARLRAHGIIAT